MQVSERYSRAIGPAFVVILAVVIAFIVACLNPPAHVDAQNAGTIGIQAKMSPVFSAQGANKCSGILPDIGQGQNSLFFATTGFSGTIDLEWSPTKVAPFYVVAQASYQQDTNSGRSLSFGGYYPNLRSCISNLTGGTVSAWYSEISGPVPSIAAATGSNGSASPIACDHSRYAQLPNSATAVSEVGPINSGDTVVICGFSISLNGAASAGNLQWIFTTSGVCSGSPSGGWYAYTTSSTPQFFAVPFSVRSDGAATGSSANSTACFINNSGATVGLSFTWASVHI